MTKATRDKLVSQALNMSQKELMATILVTLSEILLEIQNKRTP